MNKDKNKKNLFIAILLGYFMLGVIGLWFTMPYAFEYLGGDSFYSRRLVVRIIVVFSTVVVVFAPIILMLIIGKKDDKLLNDDYKSNIDDDRAYIESEIYSLNERLSSTAQRWEELNRLLLETQNKLENKEGIVSAEKFLECYGVDIKNIQINNQRVFVLTPFNSMYKDTYDVISKVCKNLHLKACRSDENYTGLSIMKHIVEMIATSRIIIANVDGRNPNVMYELGIAHALNKPTIIIDEANKMLPFDIQGNHIIIYKDFEDLELKLKDELMYVLVMKQ